MPFGAKSIFNSLITQAPAEECFKSSFNARFEKESYFAALGIL